MRNVILSSFLVIAGSAIVGCGTSNNPPPGNNDMAMGDASGSMGDASHQMFDMEMLQSGTKLVDGDYHVQGVTSDGYAIVIDNGTGTSYAVKLADGTKTMLEGNTGTAVIIRKTVFLFHDGDATAYSQFDYSGPLGVWTAANGVKELSPTAPGNFTGAFFQFPDVSSDDMNIVYGANLKASSVDVVFDKPDHSAPMTLLTATENDANCGPSFAFAGTHIVSTHCNAASTADGGMATDDGGAMGPSVTVTSYDNTGKGTDLIAKGINFWRANKSGTMVVVADTSNPPVSQVLPVGGGTPILTGLSDLNYLEFLPDDSALIYQTGTGMGLYNIKLMSGAMPTTLASSGVAAINGVSPDGKYILISSKLDSKSNLGDLLITSTSTAGTPVSIDKTTTVAASAAGINFGDWFTVDSKYVLYVNAVDLQNGIGTINSAPVAGTPVSTYAKRGWVEYVAGGSKVAYTANWHSVAGSNTSYADLYVGDATTGDFTLLATQANPDFTVTPDYKSVVYSYTSTTDTTKSGLYVVSVP